MIWMQRAAARDDIQVSLLLAPEEPEAGPWHAELLAVVIETLTQLGSAKASGDHGVVLAVDGRSSSGKTTLAARVQAAVAGSVIVTPMTWRGSTPASAGPTC